MTGAGASPSSGPPTGWIVLAVLLGTALVPLNSSMIAVDLPGISHAFGTGLAATVWVVSVYLIVMAVVQPIAGRAGDWYGHRTLFMAGLALFLVSSVLAGLSASLIDLTVFRALQALGAGFAAPNGTAMLRRVFVEGLPRVLGTVGMIQGLAAAIGPLVGAVLIARFGWSSIFWINVPMLAAALVLAPLYLPPDAPRERRWPDALGALLVAVTLVSLTLGIRGMPLALAAAGGGFAGLIWWERRALRPLIDLGLFRLTPFRSAAFAITLQNFLMYTVMLATPVLVVRDHEPLELSGLLLLVFSLTQSASSWFGGRLTDRLKRSTLVVLGFGVSVAAYANLSWILADRRTLEDVIWLVVAGAGSGIVGVAIQATSLQSVPRARAGMAAGIYATFRYLGSTLAAALLAALPGFPPVYLGILIAAAAVGLAIGQGFRGFTPVVDRAKSGAVG